MAPMRVLVVDDHSLFRRGVIAVISAQPDMQVVAEAANGREAVKVAKEVHPDIVLMDLSMPEMGGVEATYHLLKEMPAESVDLIFTSPPIFLAPWPHFNSTVSIPSFSMAYSCTPRRVSSTLA